MNVSQFGKARVFGLLLGGYLQCSAAAQDIPTVEKLSEIMAAREAALTDVISAKYSVSEKKLPGKNAWYRKRAEKDPSAPYYAVSPDNSIECAYDCWLELNGAMVKLVVIHPLAAPLFEEHYVTDGKRSWHYVPASKAASILAKPISPQMLVERKPWLPAYLTTFPTNVAMGVGHGPTLSELLSPTSGNRVAVKVGDGGDVLLEIRSAIRRSNLKDHDFVRTIRLGKQVGFAPTHYAVCIQQGSEVFSPDIETSYENFMPVGGIQVPRRIIIVTGWTEQVRGKFGDPLKVVDFEEFKAEELTVTVDELTTAATFGPDTFAFQFPQGTTVTKEPVPTGFTPSVVAWAVGWVGCCLGACWWFGVGRRRETGS